MKQQVSASRHVASWYAASVEIPEPGPCLDADLKADVCVLGGGLTGLSAALELAKAGRKVVVLEAERIGWGASGRNGGQAIFGFSCEQAKLASLVGPDDAARMFAWSLEGLDAIHQHCADHDIACDWRAGHAHVPIKPRQERELLHWRDELAERYDYPLQWWSKPELEQQLASTRYRGALYDPRSGHLHPLKYVLGLARAARSLGVQIFEGTRVRTVQRGSQLQFLTAQGKVTCEFGVLAGNVLVRGVAPELDSRVMPVGSYIGVSEPLGAEKAAALIRNGMAVADTNWAVDYFRITPDHRLLFGGRASYSTLPPPSLQHTMRARIRRVFPQLGTPELPYLWGGWIDISLNRAPHWGRLGDNLYYAQGFSGHGLNTTALAGRVIAEAIVGQSERLDAFARIRHLPFPGGRWLRTPLLVAGMAWYKLRDALW